MCHVSVPYKQQSWDISVLVGVFAFTDYGWVLSLPCCGDLEPFAVDMHGFNFCRMDRTMGTDTK